MKAFRKVAAFVLAAALFIAIPSLGAKAAPLLTADRAVQINDYQIVIEFSEPIAINIDRENRGPFTSIRIVDSNNVLVWTPDGQALQFVGSLSYVDENRDKLLFTLLDNGDVIKTIGDIKSFRGGLAKYASGNHAAMSFEEVPFDEYANNGDGLIDNITTADGGTRLWANRPSWWDGVYLPIEIDFDYKVDESKLVTIEKQAAAGAQTVTLGDGASQSEAQNIVKTERIVKNNPLIMAALIGGGAVIGIVLVLLLMPRKKREGK